MSFNGNDGSTLKKSFYKKELGNFWANRFLFALQNGFLIKACWKRIFSEI